MKIAEFGVLLGNDVKKVADNLNIAKVDIDCQFCTWDQTLKDRVFFDKKEWFAFLAAPYHCNGHTILARKKKNSSCPDEFNESVLVNIGDALGKVVKVLKDYYKPKDILFASLRGDVKHFHVHLIPLWKDKEKEWRKMQIDANHGSYEKGHLMEFLGYLEREGDKRAVENCEQLRCKMDDLREVITEKLEKDITELKKYIR